MSIIRSTLNRPTLYTSQVNVTGEFHNLTSSGTFPLPGNDTRSSGPSGAVQLSNGNNFRCVFTCQRFNSWSF